MARKLLKYTHTTQTRYVSGGAQDDRTRWIDYMEMGARESGGVR